ncbi:MAG: ribonucleoside-diphosphate reductase subunit alpha [Verrucomicrobiaceae bacterium]|nr:ribonucleoside-diphosphate reductase subunit alpha [Verrucomicrobiaceae bacterium]
MIASLLQEDAVLRKINKAPKDQRTRYEWRSLASAAPARPEPTLPTGMKVVIGGSERDFDSSEIMDTVGGALADLFTSRQREGEIFSDENRAFVQQIARVVTEELCQRSTQLADGSSSAVTLNTRDIHQCIERALVKQNKYDVARSLAERRKHNADYDPFAGSTPLPLIVNTKVIRRSGQLVPWNHNKIEIAVRKAFLSLELDSSPAVSIAESIGRIIAEENKQFMHIEDVQNLVEEELMKQGYFKVARAYIQYRALRNNMRTEEEQQVAEAEATESENQQALLLIKTADGNSFLWDGTDLKKRIDFASLGLDLCLSRADIEMELRRSLNSDISTEDLRKTVILNAKTLMQKDADFAKFSGRILLSYIYEEVLGWDIVRDGIESLRDFHRRTFRRNLARGVEIERYNPKLLEFDLDKLADSLDPAADLDFDFLGIQTLYDRYLIVDKKTKPNKRLETPQLFWMRVAMGLNLGEKDTPEEKIAGIYKMYKGRRFCSSTPTLFNSGTLHSQLSSCYLYKVDDSIESIMIRGIAENAFLSKWAGGLGGSWTSVRGTGGYIKGTNGESQGVIPFLKLHNDQLIAVNQGGKRRGSGCAYLEIWHNDIEDFLQLRVNTGDERRRTHDLNTANWIPDVFMKRMEARENWTLFRANEVPDLHELYGSAFEKRYCEYEVLAREGKIHSKEMPAIDLWKKMLKAIFETGHPWITFKDPCNVRSPQDHVGVIHSSNLCTEITLNTSADETAVCNLGSVLIDNHLDDAGHIDHARLRETIRTAVRMLDNVIDINFYPTGAAKTSNERHRPIGLGVMGLQYALYRKGIPFASKEAVEFNDEAMEAIAYYAYEASSDLAAERGTYSTYQGSKWSRGILPQDTIDMLEKERGVEIDLPRGGKMDWSALRAKIAKQGMRNSNVLAIAPTATISNIMGSSPCIEPLMSNMLVKSNLSGDFMVLNPYLIRDLKKRGLWNEEIQNKLKYMDGEIEGIDEIPVDLKRRYATAFSIDWSWLVDAAARRQKWIDQSQSVNLFFGGGELSTLSHMYRGAWKKGLKTTYYLRTRSASNIEKSTAEVEKEMRGLIGQANANKREYTSEEAMACSIEAMRNGGTCEACQ